MAGGVRGAGTIAGDRGGDGGPRPSEFLSRVNSSRGSSSSPGTLNSQLTPKIEGAVIRLLGRRERAGRETAAEWVREDKDIVTLPSSLILCPHLWPSVS